MAEEGFEFKGEFFTWHISEMGKDLMLIDRITGMPLHEFLELVDADEQQRGRGPILLALIATSIRHGHPDWSVERILRTVMELSLSEIEVITGDERDRDEAMLPPPEPSPSTEAKTTEPADSSPNGSSPSSTPADSTTSPTSYATPI
jgi:hypothetical protein